MAQVGIALGSNLGDKGSSLVAARDALRSLSSEPDSLVQAPIYSSAPVDCPESSPDFYNTVIEICYSGTPEQLIQQTQALETQLGRTVKTVHNEARVIDIDILYMDSLCFHSDSLTLPHPRLQDRRFVLQPLADIASTRILPGQDLTVLELLNRLNSNEPELIQVLAHW